MITANEKKSLLRRVVGGRVLDSDRTESIPLMVVQIGKGINVGADGTGSRDPHRFALDSCRGID
jgi:hypothetical protein